MTGWLTVELQRINTLLVNTRPIALNREAVVEEAAPEAEHSVLSDTCTSAEGNMHACRKLTLILT